MVQLALRLFNMRAAVFLAVLCFLSVSAYALSETLQPSLSPRVACENAQTTATMRECEISRYKQADAGMTAVYQRLMTKFDARGRAKLRLAQKAWRKFRDAEADFQADAARGGTLAPLIRASVLADMTASRWKQLMQEAKELNK